MIPFIFHGKVIKHEEFTMLISFLTQIEELFKYLKIGKVNTITQPLTHEEGVNTVLSIGHTNLDSILICTNKVYFDYDIQLEISSSSNIYTEQELYHYFQTYIFDEISKIFDAKLITVSVKHDTFTMLSATVQLIGLCTYDREKGEYNW